MAYSIDDASNPLTVVQLFQWLT